MKLTKRLNIQDLSSIDQGGVQLQMDGEAIARMQRCRDFLNECLKNKDAVYYGINTGFGDLHNVRIKPDELGELQVNLVRSHASGVGDPIPDRMVRLMLALKAHAFGHGHSGVTVALANRLLDLYNHDILPIVPNIGSLGASGDLAPLAHMSLALLGEGDVHYRGARMPAMQALQAVGLTPLELQSKEGLALLNGTQFMSSFGVAIILDSARLLNLAVKIAALATDAFHCRYEPFDAQIHEIRGHRGQQDVAALMRKALKGSEIGGLPKVQVQDAYSFRCIPQVLGASLEELTTATNVLLTEVNAVTDNPLIFPEEGKIVSGGNFHGQPLALMFERVGVALAEIASISERRTFKLLSGQRGLPPFLTPNSGLHSGLMIPQYTAAALVSRNKGLSHPAVTDTIDSSNGQEDHVSMGANGAVKCYQILENTWKVLGIELFTASQALTFRRPNRTSPLLESWISEYRTHVPAVDADRVFGTDIERSTDWLKQQVG